MRKTLLIAAAALAASVISSQASGVYSQNIVGYVNQTMKGQNAFNYITAPLGTPAGVEGLITGIQSGDGVYLWTGNGYNALTYVGVPGFDENSDTNVWADDNGNGIPSPQLQPNQLFIYQTGGSTYTNTFVGNCVLSNSVTIKGANAFNYIASAPPVADTVDGTNMNLTMSQGDGVYLWTGNGYNALTYVGIPGFDGNSDTYVWADGNGNGVPAPSIPVGSGFIYQTGGSSYTWTQNFQVQ